MDDAPESIDIEVNLPGATEATEPVEMPQELPVEQPQLVGISQQQPEMLGGTIQQQPGMLVGSIQQSGMNNPMIQNQENVRYVLGPNGQMMAVEKPKFSWKQFSLGAGLPLFLILVPLILVTSTTPEYVYIEGDQVELVQQDDSTAFIGSYEPADDVVVTWVDIDPEYSENNSAGCLEYQPDSYCYYWSESVDENRIFYFDKCNYYSTYDDCSGRIEVGAWFSSNNTIFFDHGDNVSNVTVYFDLEDATYYEDNQNSEFFEVILVGSCWIVPILGLVFTIVGFATGKTGLGVGGVTGLALYPFIAFFGCLALFSL